MKKEYMTAIEEIKEEIKEAQETIHKAAEVDFDDLLNDLEHNISRLKTGDSDFEDLEEVEELFYEELEDIKDGILQIACLIDRL